ncbi:MAG: N-acetylneuraminate synthase [Lachnospiraceae bacterium]|nr:N-acetylneuraminate synthase [Lachnospiraceae bacterium]
MNRDNKVLIIAEIGVNHNGDFDTAKRMIEIAKNCGVDIVKFQTFNVDALTSGQAEMAKYQKDNIGKTETQKEMLSKLALSQEQFKELAAYCRETGITFLSTPFDIESVRFLNPLLDIWKIPSGEITNYPYLVEIAKTGKKVILSTGMCTLDEIKEALDVLTYNGTKDITLLHCTTDYPTPLESVNLNAMLTLKEEFGYPVGYSDHTEGIEVDIAAVAMGATVIEKHFTLDKNMPGPDHKASLEPNELREMVQAIRKIETAVGSSEKKPTQAELDNRKVARKSIVAAKDIKKGENFTTENITTKRPGTGISPMRWNEVIGQKAVRDFAADEIIEL